MKNPQCIRYRDAIVKHSSAAARSTSTSAAFTGLGTSSGPDESTSGSSAAMSAIISKVSLEMSQVTWSWMRMHTVAPRKVDTINTLRTVCTPTTVSDSFAVTLRAHTFLARTAQLNTVPCARARHRGLELLDAKTSAM